MARLAHAWCAERPLGLSSFQSIEQIQELIHALSDTLNHQITSWFYRVPDLVESSERGGGRNVCALSQPIDRPFSAIGAHGKHATGLLKRFPEECAQICQGQSLLCLYICALNDLVADQQVFALWSQARVRVRWLDHASNAPGIQAVHDALMRDQRNIAEYVNLQPNGFGLTTHYRRVCSFLLASFTLLILPLQDLRLLQRLIV